MDNIDFQTSLQSLRLIDDAMAMQVLSKKECMEFVLQRLTGNINLKIKKLNVRYPFYNLAHDCLIVDFLVVDTDCNVYDVEIQSGENEISCDKLSCNLSYTMCGTNHNNVTVVLIASHGLMNRTAAITHLFANTGIDNADIIYFNASAVDDSDTGKLAHDFLCRDYNEMYYSVLADAEKFYKKNPEGVSIMLQSWDDAVQKGKKIGMQAGIEAGLKVGREEGLEEGRKERAREIAKALLLCDMNEHTISSVTGVSSREINELKIEILQAQQAEQ